MFEFTKHVEATAHLSVAQMVAVGEIKAAQREHVNGKLTFAEFMQIVSDEVKR